jgi:crotonobetainyl-CoA:carnitine CoA-transferase CaiB-like acyl-CoA transferase
MATREAPHDAAPGRPVEAGGPLRGVRVLDLGTMIAGPVAATLLGDFGAEVVKIEQPQGGDPIRGIGPFANGESLWFNVEGRNKKSVSLDLRLPEGQALLRRLVAHADVVVENFRPGTMAKWGLSYQDLRAVNPRIVMLSTSGFGQTGPNSHRAGYDRIGLAFGGLMQVTGYPDRAPVKPGNSMADYQSALFGAMAVMMALYHRDARQGEGQHIDLALYESVFRFTDVLITAFDKLGVRRERQGNTSFAAAPGDNFELSDGRYMVITVSSDTVYRALCDAMQRPDLVSDPRYRTHALRTQHLSEINRELAQWLRREPVPSLCERLDAAGVPYAILYTVDDILADAHYAARENIAVVHHPVAGDLKIPAPVPRFSGTPAPPLRPAPALGAHNQEILASWLGLGSAEIEDLARRHVMGQARPRQSDP